MLYAQGNYEHGYIITNQLDTIFNWINLRTNYFFENQDGKMEIISQKPERVEDMYA